MRDSKEILSAYKKHSFSEILLAKASTFEYKEEKKFSDAKHLKKWTFS